MVVAVGIDVAQERKGLDLVVIDGDRNIVEKRRRATVGDIATVVAAVRPDVVCIDSPPAWAAEGRSRAAERDLRRLGITAFATPVDPGPHPFYGWMRVGFSVFEAVASAYPRYRAGPVRGTAVEVFPEATVVLLEGRLRGADEAKAKFRRRVLERQGIDPAGLATLDSVDAALAALTGIMALEGEFVAVGRLGEGVIVVPVRVLPSAPLVRSASRQDLPPITTVEGVTPGPRACLCGCGAPVRRRFLPGHDAKLKSRLLRHRDAGDRDAARRLRELGWDRPEVRLPGADRSAAATNAELHTQADLAGLDGELDGIGTRQDLARFVLRLRSHLLHDPGGWENPTLERILDALAAWCIEMPADALDAQGPEAEQPSWQLVGRMLLAASMYE